MLSVARSMGARQRPLARRVNPALAGQFTRRELAELRALPAAVAAAEITPKDGLTMAQVDSLRRARRRPRTR